MATVRAEQHRLPPGPDGEPRRARPRPGVWHCNRCGELGHHHAGSCATPAAAPCERCGLRGPHECLTARSIRWRPE